MSARLTGRALAVSATVIAAVLTLSACGNGQPQQTSTPSSSASPSPSVTTPTPATPSPSASPDGTTPPSANADITLPGACEDIYSPAMLESLNQANPPLNDPGIAMFSTGIEAVYDVLSSGIPTLRCTWGVPSETGLSTNVSIIDDAQRSSLIETLRANGLTCEDEQAGTICRIVITYPEDEFSPEHRAGETHFLRGNGWVSTSWINFGPAGYTEDIAATLWR